MPDFCLIGVSEFRFLEGVPRTLEAVRPCTGSRSCSPYRTGMAWLRRTSAFVFDSGYKLVRREAVCALVHSYLQHTGVREVRTVLEVAEQLSKVVEGADRCMKAEALEGPVHCMK